MGRQHGGQERGSGLGSHRDAPCVVRASGGSGAAGGELVKEAGEVEDVKDGGCGGVVAVGVGAAAGEAVPPRGTAVPRVGVKDTKRRSARRGGIVALVGAPRREVCGAAGVVFAGGRMGRTVTVQWAAA